MKTRHFTVIEKGAQNDQAFKEKPFAEKRLARFGDIQNLETIGRGEYMDRFFKSAVKITTDPAFCQETLAAIKEKEASKKEGWKGSTVPAIKFAEIENRLIMLLLNLTEGDKKSVMDRYLEKFKAYFNANFWKYRLDQEVQAKYLSKLEGIASVVAFIRNRVLEREKELEAKGMEQDFLFNTELDVRDKIDLIELIYRTGPEGELEAEEMNLVQVKSFEKEAREKLAEIQTAHRRWVEDDFLGSETVVNHYREGQEGLKFDAEKIFDIIYNLAADLENNLAIDERRVIESFIEVLPKNVQFTTKQRVALFSEFYQDLAAQTEKVLAESAGNTHVYKAAAEVIRVVDSYRRRMPKLAPPSKISSLTTVGKKVIDQEQLVSGKAKALRYV